MASRLSPGAPEGVAIARLGGQVSLSRFEILLVEDSVADAKAFETALHEAATRVRLYWVTTGAEALEFLSGSGRFQDMQPPKIVVLDLHLGNENGFELLARIRKNYILPVILFTTSRDVRDVDQAYACGANAFFAKPMSFEQYIEKVRVLVEHWLDLAELPSISGTSNDNSR